MKKILLIIFLLLISNKAWATTYCTDASIGGCWLMNDTSGNIADTSGNGYNSTNSGGTITYSQSGTFNNAIAFSSSGYFRWIGSWPLLKVSLPITFVGWIKPNSVTTNNPIFANEGWRNSAGNLSGAWMIIDSSGHVQCGFGDNTSNTTTGEQLDTSTPTISASTFTHVACVINGASNMSIYINGSSVAGTYSGSGGALAYRGGGGDNPYMASNAWGDTFMTGTLDQVAEFGRALSSTDISNIEASGLGSSESGGGVTSTTINGATINGATIN